MWNQTYEISSCSIQARVSCLAIWCKVLARVSCLAILPKVLKYLVSRLVNFWHVLCFGICPNTVCCKCGRYAFSLIFFLLQKFRYFKTTATCEISKHSFNVKDHKKRKWRERRVSSNPILTIPLIYRWLVSRSFKLVRIRWPRKNESIGEARACNITPVLMCLNWLEKNYLLPPGARYSQPPVAWLHGWHGKTYCNKLITTLPRIYQSPPVPEAFAENEVWSLRFQPCRPCGLELCR